MRSGEVDHCCGWRPPYRASLTGAVVRNGAGVVWTGDDGTVLRPAGRVRVTVGGNGGQRSQTGVGYSRWLSLGSVDAG